MIRPPAYTIHKQPQLVTVPSVIQWFGTQARCIRETQASQQQDQEQKDQPVQWSAQLINHSWMLANQRWKYSPRTMQQTPRAK